MDSTVCGSDAYVAIVKAISISRDVGVAPTGLLLSAPALHHLIIGEFYVR